MKAETQSPRSTKVTARDIRHVFPNGFEALRKTSIEVDSGSFCTLLGSSGSGKTTLLRIIAGLVSPTHGQIFIGEEDVTKLPVQKRAIGFVFQNYALFPHLSAGQNIDYPLKVHGWDKAERHRRVAEILDLIELSGFADRRVDELSGGQQQRIAIGRALSYRPRLLLLDEPMGALDRKLRQQLGADLRRIQKQAGITAIYVTHDQEEAFLLSDKIAVMKDGSILECGPPDELYRSPSTLFVADFLGSTNLVDATLITVQADEAVVDTALGRLTASVRIPVSGDRQYAVSIRPENISIVPAGTERPSPDTAEVRWRVSDRVFRGSRMQLALVAEGRPTLQVETGGEASPEVGTEVTVGWPAGTATLVER